MATEGLACVLTAPHPCNYRPGFQAVSLIVDPSVPMDSRLYGLLLRQGFRRSGHLVYRPRCPACRACIPLRVPVASFRPDRGQRRVLRRNQDVEVNQVGSGFQREHFDLYRRYLSERHPGGGMDEADEAGYREFLLSADIRSEFFEFRLGGQLLAVAVCDIVDDGLSAVYTYFEPRESGRSPGVLAILFQIEEARRRGLSYLYLGYWVEPCRKMRYKNQYRPCEILTEQGWTPLAD